MDTPEPFGTAPVDDDRFSVHAPASVQDGTTRVLKNDETFVVFDRFANIPWPPSSHGLYHRGTRHLSALSVTLNGMRPLLLGSSVSSSNTLLVVDLSNPDLYDDDRCTAPHGEIHLQRMGFLWNGAWFERVRVTNFSRHPVELALGYSFRSDFVDLFEVRGTPRQRRGALGEPRVERDRVTLVYEGLDGHQRRTQLLFTPLPAEVTASEAKYPLALDPQQTAEVHVTVVCEGGARQVLQARSDLGLEPERIPAAAQSFDVALAEGERRAEKYRREAARVTTTSEHLNAWIERSAADLFMMVTETPFGLYPYAGVPWFSTPFGRDGILAAHQACWFYPEIAKGVLQFLAAHQADAEDPERDAEPGKILHESRDGEMAELREIPFGRYYGSIDSTPLFVMLAGAYLETTGDVATLERLYPHVERALAWIERHGDSDGDGFVEYGRRSTDGLVQQGWKDSHDSVWHADGRDAVGPIALCEVQGYVYAAWRAAARIARALGRDRDVERLEDRAETLREAFDRAFWCDDIGMYALALDGEKKPCRVRSSNAGHCLWSEIALPQRAAVMAETLLSSEMFSGWGVRTIAAREPRFNPMSYHNGSIWPHDSALVADGLARYGFKAQACRIFEALFDLSQEQDLHRLPELLCGFTRHPGRGPIGYPVACAPQAWSAAAVFGLLRASTGLVVDGGADRVCFDRPILLRHVDELTLEHLRVGPHRITARLHRYPDDVGVNVIEREGETEVAVLK